MRKSNLLGAAGLMLVAFTTATHAEESDAGKGAATVADLARVQAERLMYKAQADKLDAQSLYESKLPKASPTAAAAAEEAAPSLTQIIAVNNVTTGTFIYDNGTKLERSEGDKLPGGYTVLHLWPAKLSGQLRDRKGHIVDVGSSMRVSQQISVPTPTTTAAPTTPSTPGLNAGAATPAPYPMPPQITPTLQNGQPAAYVRVPAITNVSQAR